MSLLRWISLSLCLLFVSCETETVEKVTGYKGEARKNPYLAAERLAEARGYSARSLPGWLTYDSSTSLVVMPASNISTEGITRRLLRWVENGGHLIIPLEGGENYHNDWSGPRFWQVADLNDSFYQLADEIGINWSSDGFKGDLVETPERADGKPSLRPPDRKRKVLTVDWLGEDIEVGFEEGYALSLSGTQPGDLVDSGEDGKHGVVSREHGYGRVTVLNHARPLRNAFIDQLGNAQFSMALIDLSPPGEIVYLYGAGSSFFTLLWRHCWLVLLTLAGVLVVWLWKGGARFGPLRGGESDRTHLSFSNHVRAIGTYYWDRKKSDQLLEALRKDVLCRYELSQLNTTELTRESLVDLNAERADLGPEEVLEALSRKEITESTVMTRVITHLQKMRTSL